MPRSPTVAAALHEALEGVALTDADGAAVRLAEAQADAIDAGADLGKLGPQLLATLAALGMTPAARAAVAKGGRANEPAASPLDELRQRRLARQHGAAAVHTAAG